MSAMILLGTGLLFFLLLPVARNVSLLILLFGIGALIIPFVLMSKPENAASCDPNGCDGRSVSCYSGPGTVGNLSRKKPLPTHTNYTTDPSDPFVAGRISGSVSLDAESE